MNLYTCLSVLLHYITHTELGWRDILFCSTDSCRVWSKLWKFVMPQYSAASFIVRRRWNVKRDFFFHRTTCVQNFSSFVLLTGSAYSLNYTIFWQISWYCVCTYLGCGQLLRRAFCCNLTVLRHYSIKLSVSYSTLSSLYLDDVERLVWPTDRKKYADFSTATGWVTHVGKIQGEGPERQRYTPSVL